MKYILLLCYLLTFPAQSKEKITIAFGNALAPWVIPQANSGILIDIVKEALEPLGYELRFEYYPYLRRINSYRANKVDAVSDMNIKTLENEKLVGYFSGEVYAYENYAYALHSNHFTFKHLSELVNFSLMSWQGAVIHLGGEYAKMALNNQDYIETHDQQNQLKMLFRERIQVIQLDEKIFNYYRLQLINESGELGLAKVDKFSLFGRSPNGFLFKDEKVNNDFLRQLALMRQDGRYDKVFLKYAPVIN
ncbi:MAG: substrate-binding periplasmic protein [Thalassotalea sp.]